MDKSILKPLNLESRQRHSYVSDTISALPHAGSSPWTRCLSSPPAALYSIQTVTIPPNAWLGFHPVTLTHAAPTHSPPFNTPIPQKHSPPQVQSLTRSQSWISKLLLWWKYRIIDLIKMENSWCVFKNYRTKHGKPNPQPAHPDILMWQQKTY